MARRVTKKGKAAKSGCACLRVCAHSLVFGCLGFGINIFESHVKDVFVCVVRLPVSLSA